MCGYDDDLTQKIVKKIFVKSNNGWAQFWPSAGPTPDAEVDLFTNKTAYLLPNTLRETKKFNFKY